MSPPNAARQPAATQDRSHEEPPNDAIEEHEGGAEVTAPAEAAGGAVKPVEEDADRHQGDAAGQPEEPTSAELIQQLTAKTQEIALESSPPRAPTPTLTPTPTEKAAGKAPVRSPSPPPPPPKDDKYLAASNGPSRSTSPLSSQEKSGR